MTRKQANWPGWLAIPAAWYLVFILPWKLPPGDLVPSLSYAFGYNNAAAILGVAALLGILLLAVLRTRSAGQAPLAGPEDLFSGSAGRSGRSLAAATAIVIVVTCLGVWAWWVSIPWAFFGETRFFLSRLDAMYAGLAPYRDFEFGYGPAMLYLPHWLNRLAGSLIPLDTAYIVTVLASWVLGYYLLFRTLRFLDLPDSVRGVAMLLIGFAGFNLSLGVIYTPLRFLWAFHAVLSIRSLLARDSGVRSKAPFLASSIFLFCAGGFLLGPDAGITTCLGLGVLLAWSARCGNPGAGIFLAFPLVSMIAVFVVFGADYFKMLFAFGGGALNFPIPPAPYILLLLASSFWVLPRLAASSLCGPVAGRPVFAGATVCLGMGIPAALGRCDPGHVFWNGLPLFLVAGGAAWVFGRRWLRLLASAGAAIMVATMLGSAWSGYGSIISDHLEAARKIDGSRSDLIAGTEKVIAQLQSSGQFQPYPWAKWFPCNPSLLDLLRYQKIATPLGSTEDIEKFLKVSGRYVPEYFIAPFSGVLSMNDLDRKLHALEGAPIVMIPRESVSLLEKVNLEECSAKSSELLSRLYVFPVRWKAARMPLDPKAVIVCYVLKNYRVVSDRGDDLIMERISHE